MAPSALPFERSHRALKTLHRTISAHAAGTVDLPERPRELSTEVNPYIDGAISILSASTDALYNDKASWAIEISEVKKSVERVKTKIDQFENGVKGAMGTLRNTISGAQGSLKGQIDDVKNSLENQVNDVKNQVNDVKNQVKGVKDSLESQVNDVKSQVNDVKSQVNDVKSQVNDLQNAISNGTAIQLNSLRKWLDDPLQPISAAVRVGETQRFIPSTYFPDTIKDFWKLGSNPSALEQLAKHYSIRGWERWARGNSDDSNATEYAFLEDAVRMHPEQCLRLLAIAWGLQFSFIERPGDSLRRKRKVETDDGSESRKIRVMERSSDEVRESIFSREENGEIFRQDRLTVVRPRVPYSANITLREVIEQHPAMPGRRRMSFETAELGWRGSGSTDHRRFRDVGEPDNSQ